MACCSPAAWRSSPWPSCARPAPPDGQLERGAPGSTATIPLERGPVERAMVAALKRLGYESWDVYPPGAERSRSTGYNELACHNREDEQSCSFVALLPTGGKRWQLTQLTLTLYPQGPTEATIAQARKGFPVETTYRGLFAFTQVQGPGDYDKDPSLISTKRGMRVFAGGVLVEALHTNECEEGFLRKCVPAEPAPVEPDVDALLEDAAWAGLVAPGILQ